MKVYISGPMSGLPDLNTAAFRSAADVMQRLGHRTICPIDHSPERELGETEEHYWARCLKIDLALLDTCDAILLLRGWEASRGACLECLHARERGMKMLHG